jgi:glyoxylase-like metal-dependent hydrolase (beta-lactamase superfamily II)
VLTEVELELWTDEEAEARFRDAPLPIPQMQEVFSILDDRIQSVRAGGEIVSGIRTIASPGHTQGHVSLELEGGGQEVLLTGDAIATIHGAFERPDWQNLFDHEPERAAETRRRLLDRAATDQMLILGYHFPFPGLGYVLRDGQTFRYFPTAGIALT